MHERRRGMKDLNELLPYRSYYVYNERTESILIAKGPKHDVAEEIYHSLINSYSLKGDDKWALDIALDCVRTFDDSEIELVAKNEDIHNYHFAYGMYVRNQYIHNSRRHVMLLPDRISGDVKKYILGIVCPELNPFVKKRLTVNDIRR